MNYNLDSHTPVNLWSAKPLAAHRLLCKGICLGLLAALWLPQTVSGQTSSNWTGTVSNVWGNPDNWDSASFPDGAFFATINLGASVETGANSGFGVERLTLGNGDKLTIGNNSDFSLSETANVGSGQIVNAGVIELLNAGNATDLRINGNVGLSGGGTLTLGGSNTNSRILDEVSNTGVFTNVDNTIQGKGNIGFNRTQIINQGLILANDVTGALTLDPIGNGSQFTNTGTLRASAGGLLVLQGAGGGKFLNTGGRIEAQDGSTVSLVGIAAVVGGELEATGSGRFLVGPNQNGELEDVSLTGKFDVLNNSDLELKGTINNMGHIELANQGNVTDIQIAGNVSVEGGGTITLGGSSGNSRILDEVGTAGVFTNVDNTIQGQGSIGFNRTEIINQSLIDANDATGFLVLDPRNSGSQFTNTGTLRASAGGLLVLQGAGGGKFLNTGGRIEAQDGSTVSLVGIAAVVGGELEATGSGRFLVGPNQNGVLEDVSLTGKFDVLNNSDLELKGTINNMGHIELANQGNATDIQIAGNVSVEGGGTITLGGSSGNSRILDEVGTAGVFTNVDNTIQGQEASGSIEPRSSTKA